MMKPRGRSFAYVVGIGVAMLVLAVFLWSRNDDQEPVSVAPSPSAEPSATPNTPEQMSAYEAFKTDSPQEKVLWQGGRQERIYVQNNRLQYRSSDGSEHTLHDWWKNPEGLTAQAWLNGPYLLIGAQLPEPAEDGPHGEWLAYKVEPQFELVQKKEMFFGPEAVLSVTAAEEPRIFLLRVGDGEYLFDPGIVQERWMNVRASSLDDGAMPALKAQSKSERLRSFDKERQCCFQDGAGVSVLSDESGMIVYRQKPYPIVARYVGLELIDIKQMPLMDYERKFVPHVLGWFRNKAGVEKMSFLNDDYRQLPVERRLFETGWQALDYYTFTRMTSEKLEVLRFKDKYTGIDLAEPYREFPIPAGQQVTAKGLRLFFEKNGAVRSLSWLDVVNTEPLDPQTLLASPLEGYRVKEEPKPEESYNPLKGRILEGSFEGSFEFNTNAEISDQLLDALQEKYSDGDYGWSKTFRKFGSRWFVIADRKLAEYTDGKIVEIGELPITVSVEVGEAAGGRGAQDFIRLDKGWIVADTEASRVIKLNDKLELEAEIGVPMPYRLTREGDRIRIDSIAQRWMTDVALQSLERASRPFEPVARMKLAEHDFRPQEWYRDPDTGLIWYVFNGVLYQVDEKRKQYRSSYVGANRNAFAQVRIIPHGKEVRVLLDRKLERFDRQGNWLGSLAFPRVEPDGIYDRTPQGENSLIVDEASDVLYMVQGFRVIRIDVRRGETKTLFRQNDADLGKLVRDGDNLVFLLRGDTQARYRQGTRQAESPDDPPYTEIVEIDTTTLGVHRSFVEGFYDELEVDGSGFVLRRYVS